MQALLSRHGIKTFMCSNVERNYAFEIKGVPARTAYLKVKYAGNLPAIPADTSGRTFSRLFGTHISCLERFVMKRDLMGPSWLDIMEPGPVERNVSWAKIEVGTSNPKAIVKTEDPPCAPPLVVLSLRMQTILNRKTQTNEILVVSALVHDGVNIDGPTLRPETKYTHFTVVRKLSNNLFPFDFRAVVSRRKVSMGG